MLNKNNEYEFLRDFIRSKAGVILDQEKNYLIDTRLKPILKSNSIKDLSSLVTLLKAAENNYIAAQVINALTTHETYFFRDKEPFNILKNEILPELIKSRSVEKSIRIWSAACSSGQELYSIAILIAETGSKINNWDVQLIGTDVSLPILEKAKSGIYSEHEVSRGLDIELRNKYFNNINSESWKISLPKFIKIQFEPLNLFQNFSSLGNFDLILLRNVLIYFDSQGKQSILSRMHSALNDNGVLMLVTAETTTGIVDCFKRQIKDKVMYFKK